MAIQIEEEPKKVNWLGVITGVVIVAVLFVGAYLLFFKKPELIEVVAPGRVEDLSQLSRVQFNPEELLSSPEFRLLRQFGVEAAPPSAGRSNPFQPF